MAEILSLAIFVPLPESQEAALVTIRELGAALTKGGYGRDLVYRDVKSDQYILLRYWRSEEARRQALEDPDVLRCWAKLAREIRTVSVMETLEEAGG
ncbi:MAG: hypothetical protein WBX03_10125 [Terriglobales bacterium]|jgi:hypothetical protein